MKLITRFLTPATLAMTLLLLAAIPTTARSQGTLANGGNHLATLTTNDVDSWTFTAQAGDYIALSIADLNNGSAWPYIRLFSPSGNLIAATWDSSAARLNYLTASNGTYTVLVSDYYTTGTADYRLHLAQMPGAFVVADDGGALTNGGNHFGSLPVGDLDQWTFTAQAGDYIALSIADLTNGAAWPYIELFGPSGIRIGGDSASTAVRFDHLATLTGTYTVLVSDWYATGSANYRLVLAKSRDAYVVPSGDQGGNLTGSSSYAGDILLGDIDIYTFTAIAGEPINITVSEAAGSSSYYPWVQLFGRDGTLLNSVWNPTSASINRLAPASGTYRIIVSDGNSGSGTYNLFAPGLRSGLRGGVVARTSSSLTQNGAGGVPGATYRVLTATNIQTPLVLWNPVFTNQFGAFGECSFTNAIIKTEPQRFFQIVTP